MKLKVSVIGTSSIRCKLNETVVIAGDIVTQVSAQ